MPEPTLSPVEYDPFDNAPAQPTLTPVEGDPFARAPGLLGKVEAGADEAVGAAEAGFNSFGRGVASFGTGLNRWLGMSLAGLGYLGDAVHSYVAGQSLGDAMTNPKHTEASDFAFQHVVEPTDRVQATMDAAQAMDAEAHPVAASLGHAAGRMTPELMTMALTGGATAPELVAKEGASATQQATALLGNALTKGTAASAIPMAERGLETGAATYAATDDPLQAIAAGLTEAGGTALTNALPVGLDGTLLARVGAGIASGVVGGEAQREFHNAAGAPEQSFSWGDVGLNALFGAGLGVAFHTPAREDMHAVTQRYNALRTQADQGDALASTASRLTADLSAVDGLSGAALDAAEAGARAGQLAQAVPHATLMQTADRYRQVYEAALPDLGAEGAERYARATYTQEVATNGAWSAYTEATKAKQQSLAHAQMASEIKSMLAAAQQGVPPVELNKLQRWAFSGSRGTLAVRDALRQTVEDRKVPDYIAAEQDANFHPDGALTEAAFQHDTHAGLVSLRYPATPEVTEALRARGIVPYRMDDGTLAVLGRPDAVDALAESLTQQGLAPGEDHGESDLHPENAQEGRRPAEGAEEGHDAAARPAAEAGQPAEAERVDQGQAEVAQATRALDRRLAALDETAQQAVPKAQRDALRREAGELEDVLREHYRKDGVVKSAAASLTPPEVRFAERRLSEVRQQLERHEAGISARSAARTLRGKLAEADDRQVVELGHALGRGHVSTAARAQPVVDALVERGVVVPVNREGTITVTPEASPAAAQHALAVAAEDTYLEPTEAQAQAGNYRKGGVLFKSPKGDLKVRIETPDGAIRRGPWGSRKIRGAHYGYIPGTRAADGDPVDVLLTRHAHDDSRSVAVINQHGDGGQHDEIKVVLGVKTKAEALETYAKQYPPGLLKRLLPNGKRNIVMMSREKFVRYLHSGQTDVPPHPVSGLPMAHLRRGARDDLPAQNPGRAARPAQAAGRQAEAPAVERGSAVRRLPDAAREAPPAQGLKPVASDAPVYQHGHGAHPVSVVGVHYSGVADLTHLGPAQAGGGSAGAERRRLGLARSTDPLDRPLYFYVRSGKALPPKEAAVAGQHAYEARLNNLYDVAADPEGIVDAGGLNKDAILEDIHDAGYDGVVLSTAYLPGMPPGHVVQVFGDAPVPVKAVGTAETPLAMFIGRKARAPFADPSEELVGTVAHLFKRASPFGTFHELPPGKLRAQLDTVHWAGGDPELRPAVERALGTLERQGDRVTQAQVMAAIRAELPHYEPDAKPARLHHVDTLDHAQYMERLGAKPAEILKETGWAQGKDGQWRFEINDRGARLTEAGEHDLTQLGVYHLGDVLEHPALYRAYPELESMPVHVDPTLKGAGYHPAEDAIYIHQPKTGQLGPDGQPALADLSLNLHAREMILQLLHEAQHAVQAREGFDSGAAASALDYNTRSGEVEARNVMGRRRLTDEQRRQFTPEYTEDVPRERQTLRPEGLPAAEAEGLQHGGGVRGGGGRLSPAHRAGVRPVEGLPATVRVDGEPVTFGPNPRAVKAAEDYAKAAGLPYARLTRYAKVDEVRAKRIADAYHAMRHAPDNPEVKAAYAAMIRETQAQWEAIKKTGLKVEFIQPGQPDPYASNPRKAILDVNDNNHLWVFPTDAGFGSDASFDASDNPLLALTGEKINGHALRANDVFRIVHDYFGHIKEGFGFRADGEENAWRSHATMYSPLARRAMTTETRGQNSWVNFGPYAEANKTASGADTHYADQKIGLLPDWAMTEGAPETPRAALNRNPTLYSGMEKTLEAAKNAPKRAPAHSWVGWLDGAQRRGEIKQGERDWIGIDRWLAEHGDTPVTRDEVMSYIKAQTPKIEVTRLNDKIERSFLADQIRHDYGTHMGAEEAITEWERDPDIPNKWLARQLGISERDIRIIENDILDNMQGEGSATKYSKYKLPGGENYQEHLLTLPTGEAGYGVSAYGQTSGTMFPTREAAQEHLNRLAAEGNTVARDATVVSIRKDGYNSPHWDGQPNVLVHVRMDDRVDDQLGRREQLADAARAKVDGKLTKGAIVRALESGAITEREAAILRHEYLDGPMPEALKPLKIKHIHEVQSDWHQQGRKEGYSDANKVADLREKAAQLHGEMIAARRAWKQSMDGPDEAAFEAAYDKANAAHREAVEQYDQAKKGVPDAPFKQTKEWSMLGIKHAVLEAIRDGSDAIEWDTGATNADRYSLRKQVETLRYNPRNHVLSGYRKGNAQATFSETVPPERLADYIGKEAAEHLMGTPPDKLGLHVLTGDQLEVGGKGMPAFYDKLLVNEVNQWAKRFGGKVESATTPTTTPARTAQVHRLMITPAMREAASEGLPMFQLQHTAEAVKAATPEPKPAPVKVKVSHEAIARHVDGFMAGFKGRAGYEVHATPGDLPAEHPVRRWAEAMGLPEDMAGTYYNGRVYLFTKAIRSKVDAEQVTLHEMVGHGGMRAVFGDDFEDFLRDALPAMRKTALFEDIAAAYRAKIKNISDEALADEYMAALAEDADNPAYAPVWRRLLASTRNWLRAHGFRNLKWTEDDLKALVRATYRGIRDGRISVSGLEPPTVTFDDEHHMSTATYVGAKGQRGFVDHFADGSRDLRVGGLEATGLRTVERDQLDYLDVTGSLHVTEPGELIHLARFAGEEHLDGVLIDRGDLDRSMLDVSGVPYRDLGDAFALAPTQSRSSPMFALRNRATGTPAQEAILKKAIAHDKYNMTFGQRMQQMMRDIRDDIVSGDTALHLKQNYVDALASIGRYERRLNGGLLLDAAESAYKLAWMAKNTEQIMAGVMKLGVPVYDNGSFVSVAGRKGFMDIFAPLYQTSDGKSLDMLWEGYAYARRAHELIDQMNADGTPREKLLDRAEIDELLALEQQYPVFKKVLDDYQTFNNQLLDLAVERGAMSSETADLWRQNTYVPFYRARDDNSEHTAFLRSQGLSGKKVTSMRLHGSELAAQPIIENIIKNTGAILDTVYSNEAMRRVVALTNGVGMERVKFPFSPVNLSLGEIERTLAKIGMHVGGKNPAGRYTHFVPASQMDQLVQFFRMSKPVGHDIVSVMEGGKPVYYKVTDPMLLRAVTAFTDIHQFDEVLGAFLGVPKKVLTMGITLDPRFMYRNLLRDTITTWAQTGSNPNMLKDIGKNAKEVFTDGAFLNQLRVAGYNGNEYFRVNELREHLNEMHGGQRVTVLNTPKKLYRAYHKIGFVSEQINRMRIARHVLDQGGSLAEAAWQAQNVLNFQMRGDSRAMQLLIRAVPFLNARIQGLNRLYDGMLGRDGTVDQRKAVLAFLLKSAGLIAAGLALDAWNWDDPRYQRIPEASKDTYYHFFLGNQHFLLPKPFEIGAITGTLPERVLRLIAGKDNTRTFAESMQRMAASTFMFDPREGALWSPLLQDWANKDSFTGIPIVSLSEQGQLPGAQYDAMTSPTAIAVAHALPALAPDTLRSPDRLEHLYKGYTGKIGTYLLMMADATLRATGQAPSAPTSRYGNKAAGALLGTFGLGDAGTDPRTKYLAQFYDAQQMADEAAASVRKYIKEGHLEEAREVLQDHRTALAYRNELHAVGKQMKALRQAEIAVYQSTSLSPDEKRARLTRLQQTRVKLLDRLGPMLDLVTDFN